MSPERKSGIMGALMDVLREISGTDIPITDIEGFEKLVCAMMDFFSLILFQIWSRGDFKEVCPFSDKLNEFNEEVLKLAHFDSSSIESLREEMNAALKMK